jgi:hypothetical protein
MTKITDDDIELYAIKELEKPGYKYSNGSYISPDEYKYRE